MNEKGLSETIEKGEDTFTEFKEEKAHSDDLAAEIVAFANTEGGKILLGISDNYQATRSFYYDELAVPSTSVDELDILYFRRFFERFFSNKNRRGPRPE